MRDKVTQMLWDVIVFKTFVQVLVKRYRMRESKKKMQSGLKKESLILEFLMEQNIAKPVRILKNPCKCRKVCAIIAKPVRTLEEPVRILLKPVLIINTKPLPIFQKPVRIVKNVCEYWKNPC